MRLHNVTTAEGVEFGKHQGCVEEGDKVMREKRIMVEDAQGQEDQRVPSSYMAESQLTTTSAATVNCLLD